MDNSTNISEFNYNLPEQSIAKYPLSQRDSSKLLVFKNNEITDSVFTNCTQFLPTNSTLFFNNTKVIHARIIFTKLTGASIEVFCLEPNYPKEYEQIFASKKTCSWYCIIGNAKKWKDEVLCLTFDIQGETCNLHASKSHFNAESYIIEFSWNTTHSFSEILETIGEVPIPPYLHRESEQSDSIQYQTIYAKHEGSVAAPTAGLHFTETILTEIKNKGISIQNLTLHVGAGTFKPVKVENYTEHTMHHEYFTVTRDTLLQLLNSSYPIAVGTTSVRTLESMYWLGVKCITMGNNRIHELTQWDAYNLPQNIEVREAITALLNYIDTNGLKEFKAYTQIMIIPGYRFRIVKALFTNFHQPQSTLLLLICACIGNTWKELYAHAIRNEYRFLSFGDSSLLFL